ncbi:MAG: gamma-glutamylcysteine synthetase [Candidatus Nanohaloarchaea archaeon]|jgi:hypothetical protein
MSQNRSKQNQIHPLLEEDAEEILSNPERYSNNEPQRVGIESEFAVLNGEEPASDDKRDEAIKDLEFAEEELGAAMAETQTPPMQLESLQQMENALGERYNQLAEEMAEQGLSLIRYGTHPFTDVDDIQTTDKDRYDVLVDTFDDLREQHIGELPMFGEEEQIDPNTAAIPAAICSTQTNIQAESWEDAVEKNNYAAMTLPYAIALSGNSRIIEGKDTGFADTRMQLWEMNYNTDETPAKVGPLDGYVDDTEDYLSRLGIFFEDDGEDPDHFGDAIGEHWKDVRIKVEEEEQQGGTKEHYIVTEIRPLSMQPSVAEETAVHGFMIGRIAYAQENEEELTPYDEVLENREKAMKQGLSVDQMVYNKNGQVVRADTDTVLREEIDKARKGLEELSIDDPGYMDLLEERIEYGTPADRSAEIYNRLSSNGSTQEEALKQALAIDDGAVWDSQNPMETHYSSQ